MNALFVTNFELKPNDGISKKILAQAFALKKATGNAWLISRVVGGSQMTNLQDGKCTESPVSVLKLARTFADDVGAGLVYVRHMIPSPALIVLLHHLKTRGIPILYEIPTYPYFAEQFRVSHRKYRALAKLALDVLFWPFIYPLVSKVVVVRSNSKAHLFKKMVPIGNGADIHALARKQYPSRLPSGDNSCQLSLVAVGTLYPYHGYDRLLAGLKIYNESGKRPPVEFHVVGASDTIENLKRQTSALGLRNVFFHGPMTTEELNAFFERIDIGVGSLALHRRNADIDTTLKVVEYFCRGVVVATCGISPLDAVWPSATIHVPDGEAPVDIGEIVERFLRIPDEQKRKISEIARNSLDWNVIMSNLCNGV